MKKIPIIVMLGVLLFSFFVPYGDVTAATKTTKIFRDVDSKNPYYKEIKYLADKKILNKNKNTNFKPKEAINRDEIVTMLSKALGYKEKDLETFTSIYCLVNDNSGYDINSLTPEEIVQFKKILGEEEFNKMFSPKKNTITKVQLASVLSKLLYAPPQKKYINIKDVPKTHWGYNDIIKLNGHGIYNIKPNTKFNPDLEVTREQFCGWLYKLFTIINKDKSLIIDLTKEKKKNSRDVIIYDTGLGLNDLAEQKK